MWCNDASGHGYNQFNPMSALKMALSKDKSQLRYNDFLTLSGIPSEVHEYRLSNRSALEWIVDQYPSRPIRALGL